jgi:molybdopterin molybdotransferase
MPPWVIVREMAASAMVESRAVVFSVCPISHDNYSVTSTRKGSRMLEVAEAREQILNRTLPLRAEITALTSAALNQYLAADVLADIDSPPFAKSMMDGYAVRAADCHSTPSTLTVIDELAAGATPKMPVGAQQAIRLFTGAMMPDGADAVVKQEETSTTANTVQILKPVKAGQNVLPRGAEMKAGDVAVPAGTVINPVAFGLFAAVGRTTVPTIPPPLVNILVTGNELVETNMKPMGGQIRNTNGPMLMALAMRTGALPRYLGIARDDTNVMTSLVREGLSTGKILILSGGVSVGKFDLVPDVLKSLGVEIHFHHVRMKPGKPLLFGTKGETARASRTVLGYS